MPAAALHSTLLDTPVQSYPVRDGERSRDVNPSGGSVRKLQARHQPTPKTEHYKLFPMSMTTPSSSSPMILRDSSAADVAACGEIYREAVRNGTGTFELEEPDDAEMAKRRDAILAQGLPWLVA